jgi:hypothetical protein
MRYLFLTLALVTIGCGGAEPIAETVSPVGCWRSDGQELDLKADGSWRQTFDVSPTTDAGTWTYDAGTQYLTLTITSASSANGAATSLSRVSELTAAEMWTASNSGWTHWQAVACQN